MTNFNKRTTTCTNVPNGKVDEVIKSLITVHGYYRDEITVTKAYDNTYVVCGSKNI